MAKSGVSTSSNRILSHQRPTPSDQPSALNNQPAEEADHKKLGQSFVFNSSRQDSLPSLLNSYQANLNKDRSDLQQQQQMDTNYPSYYLNNQREGINLTGQSDPLVNNQQSNTIRPRGDSIFLPPPLNPNNTNPGTNITNLNNAAPNNSISRSNSIFSSLIQVPGSNGKYIDPSSKSNSFSNVNSAGGPNNTINPNRPRGLSIFPSGAQGGSVSLPLGTEQISGEDLENLLNKESLSNILAWGQQQGLPQDPKASQSGLRSKFGSIDMSMWNDTLANGSIGGNPGSISAFNGSLSDFIAGMISNGSIDLSNMSNEQRRDSILKVINDQQNLRLLRIPSDETNRLATGTSAGVNSNLGGTKLREDIFDKNKDNNANSSNLATTGAKKDHIKDVGVSNNLDVPIGDKTRMSPASSMSSRSSAKYEEPQSPKTSPNIYNARLNPQQQQLQQQYQSRQQAYPYTQQNQQQIPQPAQRPFQGYQAHSPQNPGQNQYQYANYQNQQSPSYNNSLPPNATIRGNQQMQQQYINPQQQNYQQYLLQQQQQQQQQQHQQQLLQQQQQQQQQRQQPQQSQQQYQQKMEQSNFQDQKLDKQYRRQSAKAEISPSSKNDSALNDKNLVPAQQYVKSEDGRPLLGATKIDQLMLVIQAREKGITNPIHQAPDGSILASLDYNSRNKDDSVLPAPVSLVGGVDKPNRAMYGDESPKGDEDDNEDGHKKKKQKNQQCPYCFKYFTQSTHLEVHIRSHIGYKPFECNYCHKKFTQGGNLRTHLRLHTGEKPFTCDICNRSFSRKGNLAAHKLTHDNLKPYQCKLDGCDKSFTQLGNLKSHQNRFHLNTLNELTHKLAELSGSALNGLPKEEKDLLIYFKDLYKNSNKGIRGRGKQQPNTEAISDESASSTVVSSTSPLNMNTSFQLQQSQSQPLHASPRNDLSQQIQPQYSQQQLPQQQMSQQQPLDFGANTYRDASLGGGMFQNQGV